jgi:ferritin
MGTEFSRGTGMGNFDHKATSLRCGAPCSPGSLPMSITPVSSAIQLQTGPAGRAVAQPMEQALLEGLQQHLTMERQASAAYFAMAIWFAERELRGFAHFFKDESIDEQGHAARFADYLIARGQSVTLEPLVAPRQDWSSPEEILTASFQMEADVTASLQQLYAMAERSADVRTTTFLDPLVDGQVTSENRFAHLLGRVRFAQHQPAALLIIDGELSEGKHGPGSLS